MNQARAEFLNKISAYFDTFDIELCGKNICVCLSGGADSVALLRGLLMISKKYGFNVSACHFNHMIRGDEADRDEIFCKDLCRELGVKIYCGRDDVPAYSRINKVSIEAAARECRYAFFSRVYSKENVDFCATAHNMNDDAETLLLNLIRGSGSNGASAISPVNEYILRPLLKIKRCDIESFLGSLEQRYVSDSTNDSDDYTRNHIRHVIIPHVENINPQAVEALSRYIESCRIDRDYFESLASKAIDDDLRTLHKAVRYRIILRKYKEFSGNILNSSMLAEIDKALQSSKRTILPLFGGSEVIINNGKIDFYYKSDNVPFEYDPVKLSCNMNCIFGEKVSIDISDTEKVFCENFNKLSISDKLSFDNIMGSLCVRNRRVGDKIFIHGVNKSLKKLFIEKRIPKEYRNIIPIIYDDGGIIYVPFVGISDRAYPSEKSNIKYFKTVFDTIDKERWNNAYEE